MWMILWECLESVYPTSFFFQFRNNLGQIILTYNKFGPNFPKSKSAPKSNTRCVHKLANFAIYGIHSPSDGRVLNRPLKQLSGETEKTIAEHGSNISLFIFSTAAFE